MKLTFALPALNWSDPQQLPPLNTPTLHQFCRFGRFIPQASTPTNFMARYLWQGSLRSHALASLGLPAHTPAMFASPLWQQMGMHQMATLSGAEIGISNSEAETLCGGLNEFYAAEGWQVYPYRTDLWLITLAHTPDWQATPVLDILGQVDGTMRAEGAAEREWLRWQTEIQMWLHAHPLNQARQSRQAPPINGVWLWQDACGQQSDALFIASNSVWANDRCSDAPFDWQAWQTLLSEQTPAVDNAVLLLDDLCTARHTVNIWAYHDTLQQWESHFFAPAWQALKNGQIHQLNLFTDGVHGGCLQLHRTSHWAFWRTQRPFKGLFSV